MSAHFKPILKQLPDGFEASSIQAISAPMHLPTALGNWLHMAFVQMDDRVPDPRDITCTLNAVKEHSLLIFCPDLEKDYLDTPFSELIPDKETPIEIRIHSLCRFGDALHGQNCDCGPQLFSAMRTISEQGAGIIFYMDQEGRNASLTVKSAANRLEQVEHIDTSRTFPAMGLERNDYRGYGAVADVLRLLEINKVRLMSNNPGKLSALTDAGIEVDPHQIHIPPTVHSMEYLKAKRDLMGHTLPLDMNAQNGSGHAQVIMQLRELMPFLTTKNLKTLRDVVAAENTSPFIIGHDGTVRINPAFDDLSL